MKDAIIRAIKKVADNEKDLSEHKGLKCIPISMRSVKYYASYDHPAMTEADVLRVCKLKNKGLTLATSGNYVMVDTEKLKVKF